MANVINLLVPASQGADDTQRTQRLFDWADAELKKLGVTSAPAAESSIEELRGVALDTDSAEVTVVNRRDKSLGISDTVQPDLNPLAMREVE
jgi:hypothetical protein